MQRPLAMALSILALAFGAARTAAAQAPPQPDPAAPPAATTLDPVRLEAFLDGVITDAMAREHVAGAVISVVQNGRLVLKKGYGFADLAAGRRADPDRTLFRLGSISKTFTWALLMRDVEAGRIRLDRPINIYLPEKARVRDDGHRRDVTVGHLLSHTGGFEERALGHLFERDASRVRPLELYLRQERPRRVRSAGAVASYSNYGVGLAGLASATVVGKTFERRIEEEITLPLGMTRTTFREPRPERQGLPAAMPAALTADVSVGYVWQGEAFQPRGFEYVGQAAPAGSASSTAADMSRYMLMLLADGAAGTGRIFGPTAARAFRSPMLAAPTGVNGWAHGFMVFDLPGGHRGYGHLGHTLAFKSNMTVIPDLGLGVFIATNSEMGDRLSDRLPEVLLAQFYAPPGPPRSGSADLVSRAAAFEGDYASTRRRFSGLEGFVGRISGAVNAKVTPDGRLITSGFGAARAWVPEGPVSEGRFVALQGGERLAFRMEDGRAVSYRAANNMESFERAALLDRPGTLALLAGLTAFASVGTLAGIGLRNRRELRQNQVQARAGLVQNIQAGLWLAAIGMTGVWSTGVSELANVMYGWPGAWLIAASACALVASALTLTTIIALPSVWQGGRRVDSWSTFRKTAFTTTLVIYAAFGVTLALAGALQPWSG